MRVALLLVLGVLGCVNAIELDNDGGWTWQEYFSFPVTNVSEYCQYKIIIDGSTWKIYNTEGELKVSGTNNNFWSLVQSDGDDIRVFNQSVDQLYFWIGEWDYTNQKAVIWVNLTAGSSELNIAYGNSLATKSDYEDPEQVFEFFDDFDGTELDTNKWNPDATGQNKGFVSVENSYVTIDSGDAGRAIATLERFTPPIIIRVIDYYSVGSKKYAEIGYGKAHVESYGTMAQRHGGGSKTFYATDEAGESSVSFTTDILDGSHYDIELVIVESSHKLIIDGVQEAELTSNLYTGSEPVILWTGQYGGPSTRVKCDKVIVLKYVDPADFGTPTIKSFSGIKTITISGNAPPTAHQTSTTTAGSKEFTWQHITNLQFEAPDGLTIFQLDLEDIRINGSQTIVLDAYGKIYTLEINSNPSYLVPPACWQAFYVNLTYPNGTTISKQTSPVLTFSDIYNIRIQSFYSRGTDLTELQLYITLEPKFELSAQTFILNTGIFGDPGYFISFRNVQISSTNEIEKVTITCVTPDELEDIHKNWPRKWTDQFSEAIWDQFLGLVAQIPVAGEFLADGLNFMAILVGETFYYTKLFLIDNWEITILTFESIAMMYSLANSRDIFRMFRIYIDFHIKTIELSYKLITSAIKLIYELIKAVGSLIPFT